MTLTIDLSPEAENWIFAEAQRLGVTPSDLARQLLDDWVATKMKEKVAPTSSHSDPTVALLESWLAEDATAIPEEIHEAEQELATFKRNINAPRRENGERLIFPEVE